MSDTIVNLIRNGYRRNADGLFEKMGRFPAARDAGIHTDAYRDTILRDASGRLVRVKTTKRRVPAHKEPPKPRVPYVRPSEAKKSYEFYRAGGK